MDHMIIDMSSVCWMSLLAGKDKEGREVEFDGKKVLVNSAAFGYENAVSHITSVMRKFDLVPSQLIFVVEGLNSKTLRKFFLPQYKETRDSRPPEAYEEFHKLTALLSDTFGGLGACSVHQDGVEGDDVIAYLAENLDGENLILSNDGDMGVLINERTHLWRRDKLDENACGPFPFKHITLYKALVGDTTDNIPGAFKYGDKSFLDLLCMFNLEGLDEVERLVKVRKLDELEENVPQLKSLQRIIDGKDLVYASWAAAKLYPDKVNTKRVPLTWRPGMVRPLTAQTDERLRQWAGRVRLVSKENFEEAIKFMGPLVQQSKFVSLDIETSTPEESDEWLARVKGKSEDDDLGVDVLGSNLTGMGVTFGNNSQYTFYFTHDHREEEGVTNIDLDQVLQVLNLIPDTIPTVVHNASFELVVMHREVGDAWEENGWHGFLRNVHDTAILSSYVNENLRKGLKDNSAHYLNYKQQTFQEVTELVGEPGSLPEGGRLLEEAEFGSGLVQQKRRYKMNELTARHVLSYGADDTICTAALYNHFRMICGMEKTWEVYEQVEVYPAYLTAMAFIQGTKISLSRMGELEKEDNAAYDKSWAVLREFLISIGWDGSVCPKFEELTPANVKEVFFITEGRDLETKVRKLEKLAAEIEEQGAPTLAQLVLTNDVNGVNEFMASRFKGEPVLDLGSPKKMQRFLYEQLGLPVRVINKLTADQRKFQPELAKAVGKFNKIAMGNQTLELTPEEVELVRGKASSDDTAIEFALLYDASDELKPILEHLKTLKTITTRRSLFYNKYRYIQHWTDRLVHAHLNQCATVTRRYSCSAPNLQQLPKKGEGVKFRQIFVPHCPGAVVVSIDFSGQELRLGAELSQDANMLSCYIGDKKKDMHSITAAGAMEKKWGKQDVKNYFESLGMSTEGQDAMYDLFIRLRKSDDKEVAKRADDLRKVSKNVNFGAQYDSQALTLSKTIVIPVQDAQEFLEAKYAMFPGYEVWKDKSKENAEAQGYALTMMGARRHLSANLMSGDNGVAQKALRQAPNFEIQGSAAEMTKLALARIWKSGVFFKYNAIFMMQVHDEVVFSVAAEDAIEVIRIVHECMTGQYANMKVPILGSISLGRNFGQQIECGDEFDEVAIRKGLKQVQEELAGVS